MSARLETRVNIRATFTQTTWIYVILSGWRFSFKDRRTSIAETLFPLSSFESAACF